MTSDSIKIPNAFWLAIDKLGISRATLIKQAKLPLAVGLEETKIKTIDFFNLWHALEQLEGVNIGFKLISSLDINQMPPSFLVAYHAKDLRDALYRVVRFKSLCTPERLLIDETDQLFTITITWPLETISIPNALIDATVLSMASLAYLGTGQVVQPAKIFLTRPERAISPFLKNYSVEYNAEKNKISFHQSDLSRVFQRYNQDLLKILDQALHAKLNDLNTKITVSEQVKWLLRKALTAGRPELRFIAHELATSERSLQRHLKNEGESFQSLLSKTRHELACEYLQDSRLDLAEISYLLGYEEQASFFRAFQDWENTTPSKWRENPKKKSGIK